MNQKIGCRDAVNSCGKNLALKWSLFLAEIEEAIIEDQVDAPEDLKEPCSIVTVNGSRRSW